MAPLPVAVITGGSRGIGLAVARAFLPTHRIVLVARTPAHLETASASLTASLNRTDAASSDRVRCLVADLSSITAAKHAGDEIVAMGDTEVLVNSAGVATDAPLIVSNMDHIQGVLDTNLTATIMVTRAVAKSMVRRKKGGCIVNISSVAGIKGNSGQSVYSASKAGVIGFTKSLSRELGSRGIRVNAIAPGYVDTDMTSSIPSVKRAEYVAATPLGRFGTPEEIGHAALFLSQATYITGQCLVVDGGLSA
ncbi:hypothetical protein HDU87_003353 [Geranomyces variabilis]|uniref:Ketoreductase domain-containing protein n=1 Tax=Geranomyces variabilis TaxID=109894 RepID=A0AAD5XRF6_9FUNG|nr:hypothetical protein HDU87_003353 [Geranomyces variabilis]